MYQLARSTLIDDGTRPLSHILANIPSRSGLTLESWLLGSDTVILENGIFGNY